MIDRSMAANRYEFAQPAGKRRDLLDWVKGKVETAVTAADPAAFASFAELYRRCTAAL